MLASPAPRAAAWLLVALSAACNGRGAEVAGEVGRGFGEAMRTIALIMLGLAVIGGALYVAIWARFIGTWRRGQASRTAAIMLVVIHAVALVAAGAEVDNEVHRWLWWTAPLPALALGLAMATRLPVRMIVAAAATAGLCLLPAKPPPLRSLPAAIVDLSAHYGACVVLRTGEVVCAGDDFTPDEHYERFAPAPLPGPPDADAVVVASGLMCVRHRAGPVRCHGRPPDPSLAHAGGWSLPIGGSGSTLAVTAVQILARTGDELQAWPHPLPDGLRGARALGASEGLDVHFAVVDRDGELWMWQQDGAQVQRLARFPGLADAAEVAVQARTGACVRRTTGAVACFPWPERHDPPFELPDLNASQLVALDDSFDSFCVRKPDGAVLCWEEDDPPVIFQALPTATRLLATDSALCDIAGRVRCVPVSREIPDSLAQLLALPIDR